MDDKSMFVDTKHMGFALKLACLASLFTVCLHTPRTFELFPVLEYPVLAVDFCATFIFSLEALLKINNMGYFMKPTAYFRDRWCQFDFFLLSANWASMLLHVYKLASIRFADSNLYYVESFGIVRCVRPMIIVRLLRLLLKFKVPKNRIEQLLKRSSSQIKNVTVFFVFFMAFYAIMGIQLFGRMDYRCVLPGTDPNNVTINDLMIPDAMCSKPGLGGYQCPPNMECMNLNLNAKTEGFYGMFDNFGHSVFTVYLAASEEGWVYVLYDCLDSLPTHLAIAYFITLIFFLAWLNVFIAVITETFAEIRVQFSEMWTKSEVTKIEKNEQGVWRIVRLDVENRGNSKLLKMQNYLRSTGFQCCIVGFVLANAIINASFVHYHDETDAPRRTTYYYIELGFTIAFNVECVIKVLCYGLRAFWKRNIYKFELILCIGSSLNCIRFFYDRNVFTYFQVFRLLRLIKASPMLEDFVYKIFSPGKKLGGLVIFTILFVVMSSAVSLQLFCVVPHLHHFQTFPQANSRAFMCMFQIITQEGWPELVVDVLRMTDDRMVPFVAVYFVAYHLFVTLIVLSLFVAVILDNLEMDEELKRVKQLKAKEAITSMRTTLPWRLRVFERFPTRPQMVRLKRVDSDFTVPRMRDSFTHQFVANCEETTSVPPEELGNRKVILKSMSHYLQHHKQPILTRHVGQLTMRASLQALIRNSVNQSKRDSFMATRARHMSLFETMNENGDVMRSGAGGDQSARRDLKQGEIDIRALQHKQQLAEMTRNRIEEEMRENHPFFDRPLFMIGRDSKLRRLCRKWVHGRYNSGADATNTKTQRQHKQFQCDRHCTIPDNSIVCSSLLGLMPYIDWMMVLVTLISCVSMLFESPWPPTGENLVMNNAYLQASAQSMFVHLYSRLEIADYLFVLAMTVELSLKIVADGLFFTPNALVRDVGGMMTVFIYFTSLVFLFTMPRHVEINSPAQLLMICRAMRPLRIYTLVPHIRRVVVELFRGFKEILLVTIFMIVIMFIFGSFGVQSVGGKLAACNDHEITSRENCTGFFYSKLFVTRMQVAGKDDDELHPKILVPRVWTNPRNFNFDHIGHAMLALFETLSYKGWNVVRDVLLARQGPWAVVFIHIYVFIGCMIGLTLFVGVVIANYTENRGTALLTVDQRRWHDLKARLKMAQPLHVPPKPAESAVLRRRLYELTMSRTFNKLFAFLVLLNSCTLLVPWNVEEEDQMHEFLYFLTAVSAVLNILFAIEVFLKMLAFTVPGFWQSRRNRIDLLITALGCLWVAVHFFLALPASVVGGETRLKKFTYSFGYMVVILRFFTIAGRNSTLKMLMLTVVMSMFRSLFIIAALALLVLFYAYTGVILFGMVRYGQAVSKHVNFRSGSEALVVLFRSLTGEDWNDIMHDTSRSAPFCYWKPGVNYWETDCGNQYGAIIYFCSFYLIITYIVRNLLVAVIIENFSLFYSSEEDALLSYSDIRNFQLVWNAE
ncbi:Four domain-type voltage-gated ion channel alpha-1 subunit [Aphelenchoides fujianensis]|nr:Four domain-type voltage-gated ion channel alpha-1 subunit [Aphelenchoides fujianensis]